MIRSTIIIQTYFGAVPSEIVFASPAIGNSFLGPLKAGIHQVRTVFESLQINSEVLLFANDTFQQEVLLPTLKMATDTADSSELFLRSYRLLNLFAPDKPVKRPLDVTPEDRVPGVDAQPCGSAGRRNSILPIDLEPFDKDKFKTELLRCRRARIIIQYVDGKLGEMIWTADRFSESSNVSGNLRSRAEFRQGEWQRRGIARLKVQILP